MFEWYDLDEAAAVLTDATCRPVGTRDLLRMAFAGELRMSAAIPGWVAPGVGDLVFYAAPPKSESSDANARANSRMTSITDGFFQHLGTHDFQTLRNHRRLSLAGKVVRLPDPDGNETVWVIGPEAPTITLGDLRVSAAELERVQGVQAIAAPPDAPAKHKRETQAGRIEKWVMEMERRAAEAGKTLERGCMPGTKAEFLDLLHALDSDLRSIKTVDSLDRYLSKTGCKWPLNAGKQPSAAPLYGRLFSEANIRPPGATSKQRRKA